MVIFRFIARDLTKLKELAEHAAPQEEILLLLDLQHRQDADQGHHHEIDNQDDIIQSSHEGLLGDFNGVVIVRTARRRPHDPNRPRTPAQPAAAENPAKTVAAAPMTVFPHCPVA